MFMVSFRLSGKKILLGVLAIALIGTLGVTGVKLISARKTVSTATSQVTAQASVNPKKTPAKTNEQRLVFIRSFGWEVEEEPIEILEVIIPKEFDSVYQDYNSMQKSQGFDLEKFSGKRVKRYTYAVTNYPGDQGAIRINLLVYDNKLVGGDVCSLDLEGFMHGFAQQG